MEEGKTLEEFGKKEQSQEEKTEVEVVVDVETNEGEYCSKVIRHVS